MRKQHLSLSLARTAAALVLALLTSATAWAQSLSGSGTAADPYIISSNDDYTEFASNSAYWASGVVVKLTADVSTNKMVGTDTNKFKGNFFGNGHTLTVNLTSVGENCAPFRYAEGAIFTGLHTAGTVTTNTYKYGSGLVGSSGTDVTIRNCWSSVTIVSSVNGDGTHGGFVGVAGENNVIKNSRFDGVICCTSSSNPTNSCGGFVGWRNSTLTIENCLYAPAAIPDGKYAISTDGTSTFSRNNNPTLTNSYYTATFGDAQGEAVGSKTAAELATALGSGWQVSEGNVVPVTVNYSLADAIISGVEPYYLYTGSAIPVAYTVTDFNGNLLTPGTHYNAAFSPTTVQEAGNYTLTLTGIEPYTGSKVINFTVGDGIAVTSETTTFADGMIYKVTEDVTVSNRITVSGSVKLILGEGTTLTASKGIEVSTGKQLTIEGTGKLVTTGTQTDSHKGTSGIGAYEYGDITINGGTVEATGGYRGAGIGGSSNSNFGGTITINGGIVTAQGGTEAAGIGGGSGEHWAGAYGRCGAIVINGGQVTAKGGTSAPGIGPGYDDDNNTSGSLTLGWTNATDFISVTGQSSGNFCGFSNRLGSISLAKDFIIMGGSAATTNNIKNVASVYLVPASDEAKKDLTHASITGIAASYYYTGSAISINPVVKDAEGNELTLNTQYTITLTKDGADATEVNATGNYTLTFTGMGDYTGTQAVNFTVVFSAPTNLKQTAYTADGGTMTWQENGTATQWTLQYSTDRNFSSDVTTVDNLTEATYTATALAAETTYYVRVKSVISSNESAWCSTAMLGTTATKWIGFEKEMVSNERFPSDTDYRYSLTEQIYTSEEIGQAGLIQRIAFQRSDDETWDQTRTLDVYLVHTDKSSFTGSTDWIKVTDADKVFSGSVNLVNHSWTTITLNKPFAYNGTDNLAVIIDDNNDNCKDGVEFACYTVDSHQSLNQHGDNPNYNSDPTGTCYDGTTANAKNQLRITFGLQLADDANNSTVIGDKNGQTTNVSLIGRTLYKDGDWNTLCLPFNVTLADSPLAGAEARTLESATLTDGTLDLQFGDAVSELTAGTPYIIKWNVIDLVIKTADDWNALANAVAGGNTYEGKVVQLGADITVSTQVGNKNNGRLFKGTFDGAGHTLTLNISGSAQGTAPFSAVEGATIMNLKTTGTVTLTASNAYHASGLVGFSNGSTIKNCHVNASILFPDGTGTVHSGGIIGHALSAPFTMTDCLFDGTIGYVTNGTGEMINVGGLVGWDDNSTPTITNCLNNGTFANPGVISKIGRVQGHGTINNCYSTVNATSGGDRGDDRGNYTTETGSALAALLGDGWKVDGSNVVPVKYTATITNPTFANVTISNANNDVTSTDQKVTFKGNYDYKSFNADDKSILFMGGENTLYWPQNGAKIGACRAYFEIADGQAVRAFNLNFGDDAQGIKAIENGKLNVENKTEGWYSLDGKRLNGAPKQKGVYIQNGRKVVIK